MIRRHTGKVIIEQDCLPKKIFLVFILAIIYRDFYSGREEKQSKTTHYYFVTAVFILVSVFDRVISFGNC